MSDIRYQSPQKKSLLLRDQNSSQRPPSLLKNSYPQQISGYQSNSPFTHLSQRGYVPIKSTTVKSPFPTIISTEVRKISPQPRQVSPTKYVIHNPPAHLLQHSPNRDISMQYQSTGLSSNQQNVVDAQQIEWSWKKRIRDLQDKIDQYEQNQIETPIHKVQQQFFNGENKQTLREAQQQIEYLQQHNEMLQKKIENFKENKYLPSSEKGDELLYQNEILQNHLNKTQQALNDLQKQFNELQRQNVSMNQQILEQNQAIKQKDSENEQLQERLAQIYEAQQGNVDFELPNFKVKQKNDPLRK